MFVDIEIDSKEYDLTTLHVVAIEGGDVCGSQLPSYSKKDFQEQFQKLLENKIKFSDFKNALVSYREKTDQKMQKFWEEIRTVLNKPEVPELIQEGWDLLVGKAFLSSREINPLLNLAKLAPNAELNVENEEHREVKIKVKRSLLLWINHEIKHENFKTAWDKLPDQVKKAKELWEGIKSELVQDKYAYLGKKVRHFIWVQNKESQYISSPDLSASRFIAKSNLVDLDLSEQQQGTDSELYQLSQVKFRLQFLAANEVELENFLTALEKYQELNDILVKLKQPQYRHLVETSILIDDLEINVGKINSEPLLREKTLQDLYQEGITAQKFKDALDVKNNEKLDAFWSEIKSELKKPDYAYLVKTPILINGNNYNLEPLFVAVKNEYRVLGSQLSDSAKNKLQSLVSADFQHPIFKSSLTTANTQNNQKLDDLWTQLKKILNQPEFSKWKDTSIKIKNKNYDLKLLFAAAKEKGDVKGSAFSLDAKLKLQQLLNDQVTSKMVENQLLALNQAEAEKNQQAKEKQQRQDLTIGLATGGSVLVAAGLGGFLYWFFKIRK